MNLVLDASAAIEMALNRQGAEKLSKILEDASLVISSDLYKAEAANVIWKYCRAGHLKLDRGLQLLDICRNLVDQYIDIQDNFEEALCEAARLNHSVYDMLYLTLARRNGAALVTMDKRLRELALENGIQTP